MEYGYMLCLASVVLYTVWWMAYPFEQQLLFYVASASCSSVKQCHHIWMSLWNIFVYLNFTISIKKCVYTWWTRKRTLLCSDLFLKQMLYQSLWPSHCFVSWVRPPWAPSQGTGAFHTGESIEAATALSQKMRGIWLYEQRMRVSSWVPCWVCTQWFGEVGAGCTSCTQLPAGLGLLCLQLPQGPHRCVLWLWDSNCPSFWEIILTTLVVCWEFFWPTSIKYSLTIKVLTVTELV